MASKESELNPFQAARAESLQVAGSVLSNSKTLFGGKTPPTVVENITDLLTVAEWVYGDPIQDMNSLNQLDEVANPLKALLANGAQMVEITPDKLPTLFEALARMYPDCGNPDCEVHGPAAATKDLKPESFGVPPEAMKPPGKNPFVDPHEIWKKQHGTHESPVDFGNPEQTGMAEASDFGGGEADVAEDEKMKYPPYVSPDEYFTGTVMNDRDGNSWVVQTVQPDDLPPGKVWNRVVPDAVATQENVEQDKNEEL